MAVVISQIMATTQKMEQYETKLSRYLSRKFPSVDPLSSVSGINDIQAYAASEAAEVLSAIPREAIFAHLCGTTTFTTGFIFWFECLCESLKTVPLDSAAVTKLLGALTNGEGTKYPVIRNRFDLELIEAACETEKGKSVEISGLLLGEIETDLKAVQGNIYKFEKDYVYRWLIHLFGIAFKAGVKSQTVLEKAGKQSMEIVKAFHTSAKYFPAYRENIFVSPLIAEINRFLTQAVKGAGEFPETQGNMLKELWGFCCEKDFTLREKIELCYTFHEQLRSRSEIMDSARYWDILSDGLAAEDSIIRKYALTLVKDHLQGFLGGYTGGDKEEISALWVAFFDIYDTYETYVSHLSKSVWDRVGSIFGYLDRFSSKPVEHSKADALKNMSRWLEALLRRVHTLENAKLKKYVVKYLLKRDRYPIPLHGYFFNGFMQLLNTAAFYKEGITHKAPNAVSSLVPPFMKVLVENSGKPKGEAFKEVLEGVYRGVDNQTAVMCMMSGLAMVSPKEGEKFITKHELEVIDQILTEKTKEFYVSRVYKMSKYLITILHNHMDPSQIEVSWLIPVLRYIPTAFYQQTVPDLIEPSYKSMLFALLKSRSPSEWYQFVSLSVCKSLTPEKLGDNPAEGFKDLLTSFAPLCKAFVGVAFDADFAKLDVETKKMAEISKGTFEKIGHVITSPYSPAFGTVAGLILVQKLLHYVSKLGKAPLVQHFVEQADQYLAPGVSEYFLGILDLFLNPTHIQPAHKEKLALFVKHRKPLLRLLSELVMLLHVCAPKPSSRLNKIFGFVLTQARGLLEGFGKSGATKCAGPSLGFTLAVLDALLEPYSTTIERKSHPSVIVFEPVFEHAIFLVSTLHHSKFDENSFDKSFDPTFKPFIGTTDTMKVIGVSQWKLVKELVVISTIDPKTDQEVKKQSRLLMEHLRVNALPVMVGEMLQVVFELAVVCCQRVFSPVSDISEDEAAAFLRLLGDCWEAYRQDISHAHRALVTSLFELIVHPVMFRFPKIRCSEEYRELLEKVLDATDKSWLLGRALVGQLVPILVNHPQTIVGIEDILTRFALSQEHRAEDNAVVLVKAFFNVSAALNKKMIYYDEIDFYGAFIRVAMFELFEKLINETKTGMLQKGWENFPLETDKTTINEKYGEHIRVLESLTKIMLSMVNTFAAHTKKEKSAPMTYTAEYRLRVRIGQFACVLMQTFDSKIMNDYFRKALCETDPVGLLVSGLKAALEPNNAPVLRINMEIAVAKLACEFPTEVLHTIIFPAMTDFKTSVQMRASAVFLACIIMDRAADSKVRAEILPSMVGYIGSHSAFSRTFAQMYVRKYADLLPEGGRKALEPYFEYIRSDKTAAKIAEKVAAQMAEMVKMMDQSSAQMILGSRLDDFGEFISTVYIELVKTTIGSVITVHKDDEGIMGDYMWKKFAFFFSPGHFFNDLHWKNITKK